MKICNIFPVKNQEQYKNEKYVMILAHILNAGKYSIENFKPNEQYIIMDNGLYEGMQLSRLVSGLIYLIESRNFPVNEIVVPDVMGNCNETIALFSQNIGTIARYSDKYRFMVVAHSVDFNEFKKFFEYISQFKGSLNLSIGIPKRCPFDRTSNEAIELYKDCPFPIHFLGMKNEETFESLEKVNDYVRSCDTSLSSIICKYHAKGVCENNADMFLKYNRPQNETIDLERDMIDDDKKLNIIINKLKEIF